MNNKQIEYEDMFLKFKDDEAIYWLKHRGILKEDFIAQKPSNINIHNISPHSHCVKNCKEK